MTREPRADGAGVSAVQAAEILENDCHAVVDLSGMTDIEAAKRIHADGVDILVDISGISEFMRLGILALGPAPVQVSWLSYAGTISGRLYDYLIGDPVVTSPEHQGDYLEMVARLPDSYQINDCDQVIGEAPERAEEGLPERAFVFACFCGGEKTERDVFGRWMEILRECPGAVLWLFGEVPALKANLRRAASSHGVEPIRLVFARRLPKVRHLGRVTLADLHLDTGTYGAHTTASDALWA